MVFRDKMLTCEECGKAFFFTVTDQRRLAEQQGSDDIEDPKLCRVCAGDEGPAVSEPYVEPESGFSESEYLEPEKAEVVEESVQTPDEDPIEDLFPHQEEGIQVKLIGTVKWFSREKGYGFITKADGRDLFFHRADMSRGEHAWPQDGEQVEFQIRRTDKGPEAFNVSLLPED
jgi:CspA family cold shock protein